MSILQMAKQGAAITLQLLLLVEARNPELDRNTNVEASDGDAKQPFSYHGRLPEEHTQEH